MRAGPRFGVNYTPRRRWFHSWLAFTPAEVDEDLAQIAALGFDHIRVFPLWTILQPNRSMISSTAVDDLLTLTDLAAAHGLDVCVDALQGHLSSFDFYPSWTQTWHQRNLFTSPEVAEGQVLLLRTLGEALRDKDNVFCLQLGNEMNNLVEHNPATVAEIDHWLGTLLDAAADAFPDRWVTHSAYDAAWYGDDHPFSPESSARKGSVTTVHPWVFTGNAAGRYGGLSHQTTHLAEYGVQLARAYALDADRPVWVQEVGAPEPHVAAADAPEFAERTIRNALDCVGVWGITWWCSHDVDRSLADFPELEYTLGVFDSAGAVKPIGAAISSVIKEYRESPPVVAPRDTALELDCTPSTRSISGPGGRFFDAWMDLRASGERPAVILAADVDNAAGRGITRIIQP